MQKIKATKGLDIALITSILILTFLVNLNLFSVPFLYDDYDFLFKWQTVHNVENTPSLLLGNTPAGHEGVYRPLRSIFYMLSLKLFEHNIFFYHIQELIVYSFCIILVYLITEKIYKNKLLSFFTTLSFALMSIHIDNIANLTANFDSIGVVLFFLSFYLFQLYCDASQKHKIKLLSLSILASIAAYLTYEITLILPVIILLYVFYQNKKLKKPALFSYIFTAALYFFIRDLLLHIPNRGSFIDNLPHKIIETSHDIFYLLLTGILPNATQTPNLSSVYASLAFSKSKEIAVPIHNYDFISLIPLILLIIILSLSIKSFIKRKRFSFGFIWFFVSILPAIAISLQSTIIKEYTFALYGRYTIIATYGLCLIFANLLLYLLTSKPKSPIMQYFKVISICLLITILILNAIFNIYNLNNWRDPRPLLLKEILKLPDNNADKHNDLGVIYSSEKNIIAAEKEFKKALSLNPNNSIAKNNLKKLYEINPGLIDH
jgi:hypothetical protein